MRYAILAAAASLAATTPALADEARVEARGGVYWTDGYTQGTAGIAAGYDWDLGPGSFVGAEVSGDKILDSGTKVSFGASGRFGAKLETGTKLYGVGGYSTEPCDVCEGAWNAGVGAEVPLGGRTYVKAEYRHYFVGNGFTDSNAAVAGIGIKF